MAECRLTPLAHYIVRHTNKYRQYQCTCGTIKLIREIKVLTGRVKSCGCLLRESRQRMKDRYVVGWNSQYNSMSAKLSVPTKSTRTIECRTYDHVNGRFDDWQFYQELGFEGYLQLPITGPTEYRMID